MTTSQGRHYNNGSYVYGNTARNIDVKKAIEERPTGDRLRELKGNEIKSRKMHMSALYVLFLAGMMLVTGYALTTYIGLQSDITTKTSNITAYETRLNNLSLANDDEYSKIEESVDLVEIKRIAVEELGMVYASSEQIISYTRENSDYVRQLNDLSN